MQDFQIATISLCLWLSVAMVTLVTVWPIVAEMIVWDRPQMLAGVLLLCSVLTQCLKLHTLTLLSLAVLHQI